MTWLTAPKPQSSSDLLRPDKGKRGGKARSRAAHAHTLCMESKHGQETFKAVAWFKPTETLRHTRLCLSAHVDRANTVCVTHRCRKNCKPQAIAALPVRDHPQVMFKNWEERDEPQRLPSLSSSLSRWYQRGGNCFLFFSSCMLKFRLCALMKSYRPDSNQSFCVRRWETAMWSTRTSTRVSDGKYLHDNNVCIWRWRKLMGRKFSEQKATCWRQLTAATIFVLNVFYVRWSDLKCLGNT